MATDDGADQERTDLLCLTLIPGIGPLTSRALLTHFGSARAVLDAPEAALRAVEGIGPKLAARIANARRDYDPTTELELCRQHRITLLTWNDAAFPALLREIPDPPPLLYVRGDPGVLARPAIAIVGARHASPYGLRQAARFGESLTRVGLTIVSGLARGIDAAAHRGALKAGGRTVAVLANGLSRVYPPEHEDLARAVAASGAIISEFPMGQGPLAQLFPQRNRLISGLSLGVLVVEATPRSGSLSTAGHAVEQNREVFAVPGPIDSLTSRGCHQLIRDGARLVETVDDILEELPPLVAAAAPAEGLGPDGSRPALQLDGTEQTLLARLDDQPRSVDELIAGTGLPAAQAIAALTMMEMRRLAARAPGQRFIRGPAAAGPG